MYGSKIYQSYIFLSALYGKLIKEKTDYSPSLTNTNPFSIIEKIKKTTVHKNC